MSRPGVYEVNQVLYSDTNFRSGFKFDGSQNSGVYVPVEVAYEPLLGSAKMRPRQPPSISMCESRWPRNTCQPRGSRLKQL